MFKSKQLTFQFFSGRGLSCGCILLEQRRKSSLKKTLAHPRPILILFTLILVRHLDCVSQFFHLGEFLQTVLEKVGGLIHSVLLLHDALGQHRNEVSAPFQIAF